MQPKQQYRPRHTPWDAEARERILVQGLPSRRYRPELHGVRGLAILGVVLFHLFSNGRPSGGIDIFLAVSGFLFTAMLIREAAETKSINFLKYFGRLVRRILVPAVIVIAVTTVAGLLILPSTRHTQLWAESRASLLYFENIELINSQLAYEAAGPETSPFQHFWSLSIQGQFYLVWPFVALLAVLIARKFKLPAIITMGALTGFVLILSFLYAIYMGGQHQEAAYLMSRTRAWELAFGGLFALLGSGLTLPKKLRLPAGWLGVALIVSCGFVLDGSALFPGPWALWPLAGLMLVLASGGPQGGDQDPNSTAAKVLSHGVFAWIGNHAYALYLWHWPLLIFYLELAGKERPTILDGLAVLAISTVLAIIMYRWVEEPIMSRGATIPVKPTLILAAAVLAVGGVVGSMLSAVPAQKAPEVTADWDWETYPGAMAAGFPDEYPVPEADFVPTAAELSAMLPDYYSWDCRQPANQPIDEISVCEDPDKPEEPAARIVLAGGSHAGQWHHAWRQIAAENNFELLIADMSGCPFGQSSSPEAERCNTWNLKFVEWLETADVDLVFTPGTYMGGNERVREGAAEIWEKITQQDVELMLTRGTLRPRNNMADCLASENDPSKCRGEIIEDFETNPLATMGLPEGAYTIDLTKYVCPNVFEEGAALECPAIVGNVAVWYDGSHLSNTYVETLKPILELKLKEEVPHLFESP